MHCSSFPLFHIVRSCVQPSPTVNPMLIFSSGNDYFTITFFMHSFSRAYKGDSGLVKCNPSCCRCSNRVSCPNQLHVGDVLRCAASSINPPWLFRLKIKRKCLLILCLFIYLVNCRIPFITVLYVFMLCDCFTFSVWFNYFRWQIYVLEL